ncbi:MAG TPA: hypothetical protein ENF28_02305 [Proteobacteria bacterium]|nr:hypothetical protein [Pseudomonadota bacterium]
MTVNAGNLLFRREVIKPDKILEAQLVSDIIISSYNAMGCDALNIGAYDLSLGIDYLLKKRAKAKFPFVSANLCDKHGDLLFKPWVMKTEAGVKVAIFGLIAKKLKLDKIPGGHKIMIKDPLAVATELVPRLKKAGADYVILLTNMPGRQCRRLAQHDLQIDLIVGSSRKNQISLPIKVKNTYITHLDRGGKNIGQLMLTFLSAAGTSALPSSQRFKGTEIDGKFYLNKFIQLRLDIPDHPEIGPKVEALLEKLKRLQKVKATGSMTIPMKKIAGIEEGNKYVGAEACGKCHQERYERWRASAHARAYQGLVAKQQQFDKDCIGCHSLAYDRDGGFSDLKDISFYANVQCESCHGPGSMHVNSKGDPEKIVKTRDAEICLECHIPEKSPDFVFMDYFTLMCSGKKK